MLMTMVCHPLSKAFATESRRHREKAFFSSPCLCASVAIFFHGKEHKEEFIFSFLLFVSFAVPSLTSPSGE